jgi:hypothetical protein
MAGIVEIQKAAKAERELLERAATEGKALDAGPRRIIPLALIVGTENPRHEPANLYAEGFFLINNKEQDKSLKHMALSEDMDIVKKVVELFETHENDSPELETEAGGGEIKFKEEGDEARKEQSIVSLGRSMAAYQISPVGVRLAGKTESAGFALVWGQRRYAARLYWHAKTRLDVHNKVKGATVFPAVIEATERVMTAEQAFDAAIAENRDRKGFTDLQWATIFSEYTQRKNPGTKKPYTLKEVARKMFGTKKGAYGFVRNRHALMIPRTEAVMEEDGKTVKTPAKGLTDEDRAKLRSGEVTLTWAIRRALGEQHYSSSGTPATNREKPLPLKQMMALFDATSESNIERRKAIAECMGKALDKATAESEERIQKAERTEGRGGKKKGGAKPKKGGTKAAAAEVNAASKTEGEAGGEGEGAGELVGAGAGAGGEE